jgi:hypothetical protein
VLALCCVGVLLFQLLQSYDVDLGDETEEGTVNGGATDIREGTLTTRMILQQVVSGFAEGDDGWLRLWTTAYEQQHTSWMQHGPAVAGAAGAATAGGGGVGSNPSAAGVPGLSAAVEDVNVCPLSAVDGILLSSMACGIGSGDFGEEVVPPVVVPQYDRHKRQFVAAATATSNVATAGAGGASRPKL